MLDISPVEMGEANLDHIHYHLDRIFGKNIWVEYDVDTIGIELGFIPDPLLRDKINILQVLAKDPSLIAEDPLFFLYVAEVVNNHPADFETMPMPTSLELAYTVHKFPANYSDDVKKVIGYLLKEDGYHTLCWPFDQSNADDSMFEKNEHTDESDTVNKEKANAQYVEEMSK